MYNKYFRPTPKVNTYDKAREHVVTQALVALARENGWKITHEWIDGKKIYEIR